VRVQSVATVVVVVVVVVAAAAAAGEVVVAVVIVVVAVVITVTAVNTSDYNLYLSQRMCHVTNYHNIIWFINN
jgi:hypothetical protein